MNDRQPIEEWLREAYGSTPACPPPESFLRAALDATSSDQRGALEEHAAACPACAVERDLAREFDAPPERIETVQADVDHVVSALQRSMMPARTVSAARSLHPWALAAAAFALVAIAGLATLRSPGPALPERTNEAVVRGSRVQLREPIGDLESRPGALSWESVPAATDYRVRLLAVDDAVIYETTTREVSISLPEPIAANLHKAVVYSWWVEGLNRDGGRVAMSEVVTFRVKP